MNESCTAISSRENIQLLQSYTVTYRKKLKEVLFVEEEFLYKKISKKDNYVDYASTADMAEDAVVLNGFCFLLDSDGDAKLYFAFPFSIPDPGSTNLSVLV